MTDGELKDIKRNYEELTKTVEEMELLEEAIEIYEQHPVVKQYLNLKRKLEIGKSRFKIEGLSDDELLDYIINSIGVSNPNNIYVYIGTYQQNDEKNEEYPCDFNVPYDDSNADYRLYMNIELPYEEKTIICTLQLDFEQQNIVLYPPKGINSATYFSEIRNMYFKTAIKYGQEKALEKILEERNRQKNQYKELGLNKKDECKESNQHPISELDHDVIHKIIELQGIILDKKQKSLSVEKMIRFLNSAMNYGKFQIWLLENQIDGVKLSTNDKLKKFLEETSTDEILTLYDIEQNYDDANLENIAKQTEKGPILEKIRK